MTRTDLYFIAGLFSLVWLVPLGEGTKIASQCGAEAQTAAYIQSR